MKLELKENMYVRTKDGIIAKVDYIDDNTIFFDKDLYRTYSDSINFLEKDNLERIVKASYNIIDLISRFDLVNGHLVICKMYEDEKDIPTIIKCVGDYYFKEEDIKSIVTKEQMKQIEYRV